MKIIPPSPDDIACPFCGKTVCLSAEHMDETGWVFDPDKDICEHTLFVATSEGGFEYRSSRFNHHMNLPDDQEAMPDLPPSAEDPDDTMGFDEFTSCVTLPGAVKMTSTDCFIDAYVGFAP